MTVYVFLLEGEPLHVYTSLQPIKEECFKYFDKHQTDYFIEEDFRWWRNVEEHNYQDPYGEFDIDRAWDEYVNERFSDGTWGDYAWYECTLD